MPGRSRGDGTSTLVPPHRFSQPRVCYGAEAMTRVTMAVFVCALSGQSAAAAVVDLAALFANSGFENDLAHSQWTATKKSANYRLDAPVVNPTVVPYGASRSLAAPAGRNFVGVRNPFDEDINGRLVHVPVSGFFAAGTTFTITAFGNRGRLSSAPSGQLGSDPPTLSLQVFTWPAGSTPVVNPQTDNWSRTPGAVLTRQFTAWSTSGTWTSQTFQFVINVDQRYVALAITGKNHTSASYVAFDVAPPR
jgi:hypothetical protein